MPQLSSETVSSAGPARYPSLIACTAAGHDAEAPRRRQRPPAAGAGAPAPRRCRSIQVRPARAGLRQRPEPPALLTEHHDGVRQPVVRGRPAGAAPSPATGAEPGRQPDQRGNGQDRRHGEESDLEPGRAVPSRAVCACRHGRPLRQCRDHDEPEHDPAAAEQVDDALDGQRLGPAAEQHAGQAARCQQRNEEHRERDEGVVRVIHPRRVVVDDLDLLDRPGGDGKNGRGEQGGDDRAPDQRPPWGRRRRERGLPGCPACGQTTTRRVVREAD